MSGRLSINENMDTPTWTAQLTRLYWNTNNIVWRVNRIRKLFYGIVYACCAGASVRIQLTSRMHWYSQVCEEISRIDLLSDERSRRIGKYVKFSIPKKYRFVLSCLFYFIFFKIIIQFLNQIFLKLWKKGGWKHAHHKLERLMTRNLIVIELAWVT